MISVICFTNKGTIVCVSGSVAEIDEQVKKNGLRYLTLNDLRPNGSISLIPTKPCLPSEKYKMSQLTQFTHCPIHTDSKMKYWKDTVSKRGMPLKIYQCKQTVAVDGSNFYCRHKVTMNKSGGETRWKSKKLIRVGE
jgi:hypothetical protein